MGEEDRLNQPCRVCGEVGGLRISSSVSDAPDAAVYRCAGCGLVFLHPIMTEQEEAAFYEAQFEAYMQERGGPRWKSPEAHFVSAAPEAARRLRVVAPFLDPDQRVLEVGSATGFFLDSLKGRVARVHGIEPSQAFREHANEIGIPTEETLAGVEGERFDVIFLYYVLEHLRDGRAYLRDLGRFLRPGGRILLEVPNVDDVLVSRYELPEFEAFYWQKAHYYYYDRNTLAALIRDAGYGCQMFPEQRYDLSNHMVWLRDRRPGGAGAFGDLFDAPLESAYAEALKAGWVCDTLFAVATAEG